MKRILAIIRSIMLPDPSNALRSPMIQDFINLSWDIRQGIIECSYEGELEMYAWDIEWLRTHFNGLIPDRLLNEHLDDLDYIYRMRYHQLHGYAI